MTMNTGKREQFVKLTTNCFSNYLTFGKVQVYQCLTTKHYFVISITSKTQ